MSVYEGLTVGSFKKSTAKRLPICFCLDVSGSMLAKSDNGVARIVELSQAFNTFISTMKDDPEVAEAADIAILSFGDEVKIVQPMMPISEMKMQKIKVKKGSFTPLGEAVLAAVKLLELRKNGYKEKGMKYYQPWLVVLTDGEPEGEGAVEAMEEAIKQANALEQAHKLVVFNVAIGSDADFSMLRRLSVRRPEPIRVEAENLDELFEFLGSSSTIVVNGGELVPPEPIRIYTEEEPEGAGGPRVWREVRPDEFPCGESGGIPSEDPPEGESIDFTEFIGWDI